MIRVAIEEGFQAAPRRIPAPHPQQDLSGKQDRVGHDRAVRIALPQPVQGPESVVGLPDARLAERHIEERGIGDARPVFRVGGDDPLELRARLLQGEPAEEPLSQSQPDLQVGGLAMGAAPQVSERIRILERELEPLEETLGGEVSLETFELRTEESSSSTIG